MTDVNLITTPVLDGPNDQPIIHNVYDGPPINDYSNPTHVCTRNDSTIREESTRSK